MARSPAGKAIIDASAERKAWACGEGPFIYQAGRIWDVSLPPALVIVTHPPAGNTAPAACRVAQHQGCGWVLIGATHAFECESQEQLAAAPDAVGPDNDRWVFHMAGLARRIVLSYGPQQTPEIRQRGITMARKLVALDRRPLVFGQDDNGDPLSILYQSPDANLVPWKDAT